MKVAIAGAGITGSYLYRLLKNRDWDVHLYERAPSSGCGLTPCAWGTSADFFQHVAAAGLDGKNYILQRSDHLLMDEVRVRSDLLTVDKPQLVRDLLRGARPIFAPLPLSGYDRIIDATGVARALLPPIPNDLVLDCCQFLLQSRQPLPNRITLGGIGYAWSFPLAENRYHVGCGSLFLDPRRRLERLGWLASASTGGDREILCHCAGRIRLTGPHLSQPFVDRTVEREIWGIGEAIGCVAPLAGDGIVPGMRSVQLLLENWDDPNGYRQAVLSEFRWMRKERTIIEMIRRGRRVGWRQARVLRKNARRMGLEVGLRDAVSLLKNLGNPPA